MRAAVPDKADERALWKTVTRDVLRPAMPTIDAAGLNGLVARRSLHPIAGSSRRNDNGPPCRSCFETLSARRCPCVSIHCHRKTHPRPTPGKDRSPDRSSWPDRSRGASIPMRIRPVMHRAGTLSWGLIITGRGRSGEGVLRRNVPLWLEAPTLRSRIKAVRTRHSDRHGGGEGARLHPVRAAIPQPMIVTAR